MSTFPAYRPRGGVNRLLTRSDDFMNWFLYGHETWLVATLKGVALFLFMYFLNFVGYFIGLPMVLGGIVALFWTYRRKKLASTAT